VNRIPLPAAVLAIALAAALAATLAALSVRHADSGAGTSRGATPDPLDGAVEMRGRVEVPERTWVESGGHIYGAKPDALGPIGGGKGYARTVAKGDYRVSNLDGLLDALRKAKPGQVVYVADGAEIDCTARVLIEKLVVEVPGGVTLAGGRGRDGSPGPILYSDALDTLPLVRAAGADVRITGLRIRGPDAERRLDHRRRAFGQGRGRDYYYLLPISRGVYTEFPGLEVDNCELSGWSHSAVCLDGGTGHRVHHNAIHHNQRHGLGYGICLDEAEALIEQNLFGFNRHSIAGTGRPGTSYEARHNVDLGELPSHCFDMHGWPQQDGAEPVAGTRVRIHHNTFLASQTAIDIRGIPEQECRIDGNWFPNFPSAAGAEGGPAVRCHDGAVVQDNRFGP